MASGKPATNSSQAVSSAHSAATQAMAAASDASRTEFRHHAPLPATLRPALQRQPHLNPAENEMTEEIIPTAPRMPS